MKTRTKEHINKIINSRKGYKHSEDTKRKIGLANRGVWIKYKCDYCKKNNEEKQSHYKKSKKHFCNRICQGKYYSEKIPFWKQAAYKGIRKRGESRQVYHRNYCKTHKVNISHLKARRYAREKGAVGNHTLKEWQNLKQLWNYCCSICSLKKPLTKDHIIPLSKGGTDFIENIQPLCRNCNSKKWNKMENPELLEVKDET